MKKIEAYNDRLDESSLRKRMFGVLALSMTLGACTPSEDQSIQQQETSIQDNSSSPQDLEIPKHKEVPEVNWRSRDEVMNITQTFVRPVRVTSSKTEHQKLDSEAARKQRRHFKENIPEFIDEPWAQEVLVFVIYHDTNSQSCIIDNTKDIIRQSWAKDFYMSHIASNENPFDYLPSDTRNKEQKGAILSQPWFKDFVIKVAIYKHNEVLENFPMFSSMPWARSIIQSIGKLHPRDTIKHFPNYSSMPWSREMVTQIAQRNPDAFIGNLTDELVSQPWCKEMVEKILRTHPEMIVRSAPSLPYGDGWKDDVLKRAFEGLAEK